VEPIDVRASDAYSDAECADWDKPAPPHDVSERPLCFFPRRKPDVTSIEGRRI